MLRRYDKFLSVLKIINDYEGGLEAFSRGYEQFGFITEAHGIRYREWAPGVKEARLIGEFSTTLIAPSAVTF